MRKKKQIQNHEFVVYIGFRLKQVLSVTRTIIEVISKINYKLLQSREFVRHVYNNYAASSGIRLLNLIDYNLSLSITRLCVHLIVFECQ